MLKNIVLSALVVTTISCSFLRGVVKEIDPDKKLAQAEQALRQVRQISEVEYKRLCLPFLVACAVDKREDCHEFDKCIGGLERISALLSEAEGALLDARKAYGSGDVDDVLRLIGKIFKLVDLVREDVARVKVMIAERDRIWNATPQSAPPEEPHLPKDQS